MKNNCVKRQTRNSSQDLEIDKKHIEKTTFVKDKVD